MNFNRIAFWEYYNTIFIVTNHFRYKEGRHFVLILSQFFKYFNILLRKED